MPPQLSRQERVATPAFDSGTAILSELRLTPPCAISRVICQLLLRLLLHRLSYP